MPVTIEISQSVSIELSGRGGVRRGNRISLARKRESKTVMVGDWIESRRILSRGRISAGSQTVSDGLQGLGRAKRVGIPGFVDVRIAIPVLELQTLGELIFYLGPQIRFFHLDAIG